MSVITDAILFPGLNAHSNRWPEILDHISWQYDNFRSTSWKKIDLALVEDWLTRLEGPPDVRLTGGNKVFTFDFWAGAFNYLPPRQLVERVRSAPWNFPQAWLLVVEYEYDDEGPTVYWHDGSYPRQEPRE